MEEQEGATRSRFDATSGWVSVSADERAALIVVHRDEPEGGQECALLRDESRLGVATALLPSAYAIVPVSPVRADPALVEAERERAIHTTISNWLFDHDIEVDCDDVADQLTPSVLDALRATPEPERAGGAS